METPGHLFKSYLMLPPANPYASPKSDGAKSSREGQPDGGGAKRLCFGWLVVFALNLVVPLFLGWNVAGPDSRVGMFLAVFVLLAIGLWICASARQVGFALVVGGSAVALSQVCPILQMMAGILSFAFSEATGVVSPVDGVAKDGFPEVETILAGFVMTMTTGGLLAAASLVAGLAIRAVLALRRC